MSEWFCPLPFKHAYIDSTGISPCCRIPRYQTTMDQWSTFDPLVKLQQDFINGIIPNACEICVNGEKEYGTSLRLDSNRDYNHQQFDTTDIDFIDFRSINICNFKCRSCNPIFSHGIAQEINNHPALETFLGKPPISKTAAVSDANVGWITQNLGSLKRIMFTGGEPTVIPEVKNLVKKIKQDYKDIMVLITSNASFQDDFWFKLTEDLPNLHWTVSVDVVGPRSAIVRHGSEWSLIEKNVEWLAQHSPSLDINSVVSNLTIFGLKPLLEFGRRMQKISIAPSGRHGDCGCRHQLIVTPWPGHMVVTNLTDELRQRALVYLNSCQELDLDSEQRNIVTKLIEQISNSKFNEKLWNRGEQYNLMLDKIRGENHLTLFEEQL